MRGWMVASWIMTAADIFFALRPDLPSWVGRTVPDVAGYGRARGFVSRRAAHGGAQARLRLDGGAVCAARLRAHGFHPRGPAVELAHGNERPALGRTLARIICDATARTVAILAAGVVAGECVSGARAVPLSAGGLRDFVSGKRLVRGFAGAPDDRRFGGQLFLWWRSS